MTDQIFKLEITATSPDGIEINQNTKAKVKCTAEMAIGVMIHTLKSNKDVEQIVLMAVAEYLQEKEEEKIKMN
jgi:transposase